MNRWIAVAVAVLVLAAATPAAGVAQTDESCSFPVERTDATGTVVRVPDEPARVVTLSPSAAQTMKEIGAWGKVVGATKHAAYLEGFEDVERNISGAGGTINTEEVVGLEADLVLAPNVVPNETVEALRGAGETVYYFPASRSIEAIKDKTRLIGRLTGECAGAAETVAWMDSRLAVVDETTDGVERPSAIYVFFGFAAGEGTFIGDMIERAGARNAAALGGVEGFQEISEEVLLDQDPDWLLLGSDAPGVPSGPAYNGTTAIREDQILVLDVNYLNQPAPRVVIPIQRMTKAFHPEAYAAANATEPATPADTSTSPDASTTTAPGSDGPGFGPLVAILALMAVATLARSRR